MPETMTQTAPVVVDQSETKLTVSALKAIRQADGFPTLQQLVDAVIADGVEFANKGVAANHLTKLIESGALDEALRSAAAGRPTVKRKPLHDKHGHVKSEDRLGRKGHRELRHGVILRNGTGFRVCGRTTKDLSEEQKEILYRMRKQGASWGKISNDPKLKLEYNHGMTARNIFLAVQRAKAR